MEVGKPGYPDCSWQWWSSVLKPEDSFGVKPTSSFQAPVPLQLVNTWRHGCPVTVGISSIPTIRALVSSVRLTRRTRIWRRSSTFTIPTAGGMSGSALGLLSSTWVLTLPCSRLMNDTGFVYRLQPSTSSPSGSASGPGVFLTCFSAKRVAHRRPC